jgi:hypothetical protein
MTIALVTAGSYVTDELAAEFGRLPTAFLPIGHKRLYDIQFDLLGGDLHVSLPASYDIPAADQQRFAAAGAQVVRIPDGLTLGQSVLYALETIGRPDEPVRILHGDTIIHDIPKGLDTIAVGRPPDAYAWGAAGPGKSDVDDGLVLAGYFAFADPIEWRRALVWAEGDFVAAVHRYAEVHPLASHTVQEWLDFGHLQTYYRSRCSIRTHRMFNAMSLSFTVVEKRSQDAAKLAAEARWYEDLPAPMRLYTPAYLGGSGDGNSVPSYAVEYLPIPSLHELFVFGDLGAEQWRSILAACFEFLEAGLRSASGDEPADALQRLTLTKTAARLTRFLEDHKIAPDREWRYRGRRLPSLPRIAQLCAERIDYTRRDWLGIMHGDLCFTNVFYDFRIQRVRVIDPRGTIDGTPTNRGDARYDLAKLAHSILGGYDHILAGRFACSGFEQGDLALDVPPDRSRELVAHLCAEPELRGARITDPEIVAVAVHLFLSMLPLHADRPARQQAFVAAALRLFAEELDR